MAQLNDLLVMGQSTLLGPTNIKDSLTVQKTLTVNASATFTRGVNITQGYNLNIKNGYNDLTFLVDGGNGNTTIGGNLSVNGLNGGHHAVASYCITDQHSSGYYKININSENSWMSVFTIRLYQSYTWYDIIISGYNYGQNYWYLPRAITMGSSTTSPIKVTFGYDQKFKLWVAIPAGDYTGLDIINVVNGYQPFDSYKDLFTITYQENLTGTTQTSVTATFASLLASSSSGYYGIILPNGSSSDYLRTTQSGIIPYTSGGSGQIGTSDWPFNAIYSKQFYATSDKRVKTNLCTYNNNQGKSILDLPIYKFDFINNGAKNQIGCIAQDLKEICPEIVTSDENGYLSIQESKIVYLLIDEIKKLKEEIKQLKGD